MVGLVFGFSTVASGYPLAERINYPQHLHVVQELGHIGVIVGPTLLPLALELFQGVLASRLLRNTLTPGTVNRNRTSSTNDFTIVSKQITVNLHTMY